MIKTRALERNKCVKAEEIKVQRWREHRQRWGVEEEEFPHTVGTAANGRHRL